MENYVVGYFITLILGIGATWLSGLFLDDKSNEDYQVVAYVLAIIATGLLAGNIAIVMAIYGAL